MRRTMLGFLLPCLAVALLILAGCATESKVARIPDPPPLPQTPLAKERPPDLPAALPVVQTLPKPAEIEGEVFKERLYSLSYREAEVRDVLMAFSRESNYNIIVDPEVGGKITVDLKKVTLPRALDSLLKPLGLDYKQEGRYIQVTKPKMETRMYNLNYLSANRSGISVVRGSGGAGPSTTTMSGGVATSTSGTTVVSEVKSEETTNLWNEIEGRDKDGKLDDKIKTGLRALLSERGSLAVNKLACTLMVNDLPRNLEMVEKFLQQVERTVNRQVIIEAKIIEVTLNDRFQMGIDWRFLPQMTSAGLGWTGNQNLTGTSNTIPPSWQVPAATTGLQAGIATLQFTAMLDLLSQQGQVNVISSPRVSTLNNQKSIIKAAVEEVYFEVSISTSTGGPPIITATPRNVTIGVILNVTPQIDGEGNILLDIQPSVTEEVTRRTQQVGFSGTTPITTEAPVVSVRQAQTVARVRDGQTIVIAGLIRERKRNQDTGVPGLMDIPLLGYLFKNTQEIKEKSELVILITPKILQQPQILDFTRQDLQRAGDLQKQKSLDERQFCPTCPQ
ncbi:MAG: secretin and TonB N-terminal domain-containing protein [Deltaproteobacteria bacterium]|nr:secretin and TonB N-terminal domain-containing protein [Deltaproteobacteria bacterium]